MSEKPDDNKEPVDALIERANRAIQDARDAMGKDKLDADQDAHDEEDSTGKQ